jgi:hypothetical protein
MTAHNVGEEDIKNVRAVLSANDIHAANTMDIDIDAMGFRALRGIRMRSREQRERKRFRISDRRRRKAKSKKKCPKRRGPRLDSNPRGYEQGIGPGHQRTGRHEPSSYTCDRGHKFYQHWDRIWAICPLQGSKCTTHGAALVIEGTRRR